MARERVLPGALARLGRRQTPVTAIGFLAILTLSIGLPLTYAYGGGHTFGYLAGAAGLSVVLIYLAVNVATIRAFRRDFRRDFRFVRHFAVPATAALLLLFPLWGVLHPPTHKLPDFLPFIAFGWLCLGAVVLGLRKARSSRSLRCPGSSVRSGRCRSRHEQGTEDGRYQPDERGWLVLPPGTFARLPVAKTACRRLKVQGGNQANVACRGTRRGSPSPAKRPRRPPNPGGSSPSISLSSMARLPVILSEGTLCLRARLERADHPLWTMFRRSALCSVSNHPL